MLHLQGEVTENAHNQYDVAQSLCMYMKVWLLDVLNFLIESKEGTENYGQKLLDRLHLGNLFII